MNRPGRVLAAVVAGVLAACVQPSLSQLPDELLQASGTTVLLVEPAPGVLKGATTRIERSGLPVTLSRGQALYALHYALPEGELELRDPCSDCLRVRAECPGCTPMPDPSSVWTLSDAGDWSRAPPEVEARFRGLSLTDSDICARARYTAVSALLPPDGERTPRRTFARLAGGSVLLSYPGRGTSCQTSTQAVPVWRADLVRAGDGGAGPDQIALVAEPLSCALGEVTYLTNSRGGRVFLLDARTRIWERSAEGAYSLVGEAVGASAPASAYRWLATPESAQIFYMLTATNAASAATLTGLELQSWHAPEMTWRSHVPPGCTPTLVRSDAVPGGAHLASLSEDETLAFGPCREGSIRMLFDGQTVSATLRDPAIQEFGQPFFIDFSAADGGALLGSDNGVLATARSGEPDFSLLSRLGRMVKLFSAVRLVDRYLVVAGLTLTTVFPGIQVCEDAQGLDRINELSATPDGAWALGEGAPARVLFISPERPWLPDLR